MVRILDLDVNDEPFQEMNRSIQGRIDGIQSAWSAPEIIQYVNNFLDFVVQYAYPDGQPTPELLREYLKRLADQLRACHYQARQVREYMADLRERFRLAGQTFLEVDLGGISQGAEFCSSGRYRVATGQEPGDPQDPDLWGIYETSGQGRQLANIIMVIDLDKQIEDEIEPQRHFRGVILLHGIEHPFEISAEDYGTNPRFKAAIYCAAGAKVKIHCHIDELRNAVGELSLPARRRTTTNFGWTDAYLVASGRITAQGFQPACDSDPLHVDLSGEEKASRLDLQPLSPEELPRAKRHIIDDFLALHDHVVTYAALAAIAAAILARHVEDVRRFALWLVGPTGAGKTFIALLAQCFFGRFRGTSEDHVASWTSTVNYLQRLGYFFRDALFVVDDYKPEYVPPWEAIRFIQNYADGTGRGRLRRDATTNTTRPVRGFLLSTGEEMPEQSPSVMARCIRVGVRDRPEQLRAADLQHGQRCLLECHLYPGITADFIRSLLAEGRLQTFPDSVLDLRDVYFPRIAGHPNAPRIAGNFALLAASFYEFARYFRDVWPEWEAEARSFIEGDLVALCEEMVGAVREQRAGVIFLEVLTDLVRHGRVRITNYRPAGASEPPNHAPLIGSRRYPASPESTNGQRGRRAWLEISTTMSLAEVNDALRRRGKPMLQVSDRALLQQLRQDGHLLDRRGEPLPPDADGQTTQAASVGGRTVRVFRIASDVFDLAADESSHDTAGPVPVPEQAQI